MKYPRKPRLKNFNYSGLHVYFVTVRTAKNRKAFAADDNVVAVHSILTECAKKHHFIIVAYCFMPDHLHLLLEGQDCSSLKHMMKEFKQKTSYLFRKRFGEYLWQQSYYDHILRSEESFIRVGRYIVDNPVRAKLVKDFQEYPYIGSDTLDLKDFLTIEPYDMGKPT